MPSNWEALVNEWVSHDEPLEPMEVEECPRCDVRMNRGIYRATWHARWQLFFSMCGRVPAYRSAHYAVTTAWGIRPTFDLKGIGLVHIVPNWPAPGAIIALTFVAADIGRRCLIIPSPPFGPARQFSPPSPPVWSIETDGRIGIKHWGFEKNELTTVARSNPAIFHRRVSDALDIAGKVPLHYADTAPA